MIGLAIMLAVAIFVGWLASHVFGMVGGITVSVILFICWYRFNMYSSTTGLFKANLNSYFMFRRSGRSVDQALLSMVESQPLLELIAQKQEHYGSFGTGFDRLCLVVYYNLAVLYNRPVEALNFKFEDVVQAAKQFIGDDPKPFDDIFLFLAINDGRVFRIV